jgi:DNA-binding MarR family transcriptional regulator
MTRRVHEELKQSRPFPRLRTEALVGVRRTAAVLDHALGEALKPYGITITQFNVLRILRGAGGHGLCGREVSERLISQVPDVSRLLDRMVEMGLVRRERDEADRRHMTARITEEGRRLLERADPVVERVEDEWFGEIGEEELRKLIDLLGTVREHG